MKKTFFIFIAVLVLAIGLLAWKVSIKTDENRAKLSGLVSGTSATVVASSTCGCCKLYAQYLKQQGFDLNVQEKSYDEVTLFKDQNLIPATLRSCHTSRIGRYIVEGHVPMEAIEKLLKEQPDIRGIGMAGMPSGSPGMPGPKTGPFVIDTITNDGRDGGLFLKI